MDEMSEKMDNSVIKGELLAKMGDKADVFPMQLEQRFPRIFARITELWGRPALDSYLDDLLLCDRDGRQGFPPDIAMELFRLTSAHDALGLSAKKSPTGWAAADDSVMDKKASKRGE